MIGAYRMIACDAVSETERVFCPDEREWLKARDFATKGFYLIFTDFRRTILEYSQGPVELVKQTAILACLVRVWILANDDDLSLAQGVIQTCFMKD